MTSADIVHELRSARPTAPDALRARVASLAHSEPTPRVGLAARFAARRRLVVLVPVTAAIAVATIAGIALTGDGREAREATPPTASADLRSGTAAPEAALDAQAQAKAAAGIAVERAQSFSATLTLRVEDGAAVAEAAQRAISVADELGGFVTGSQVATGDEGYASITLKVPFARAREAVTRLSRLGTIAAQDVRLQDLQETLDALDRQIRVTRNQLATVLARLASDDLGSLERSRLEARRDGLREQLRAARSGRAATAGQARLATIQVELRSEDGSGVTPVGSRIDRTLDRALEILAWEGAIAAALLIVAAPFALVVGAAWLGRRTLRRRTDEQLLSL